MTPTALIGYVVLFAGAAVAFLLVSLLLGRLLRAQIPSFHKGEAYECGEPAVGSSFVQFNLRFYVVALIFLIFDVEVAFFFPWATVFGKAAQLSDPTLVTASALEQQAGAAAGAVTTKMAELGVRRPENWATAGTPAEAARQVRADGRALALVAMIDLGVFFAVLMVGFAYVWARGDIDWILTLGRPDAAVTSAAEPPAPLPPGPIADLLARQQT